MDNNSPDQSAAPQLPTEDEFAAQYAAPSAPPGSPMSSNPVGPQLPTEDEFADQYKPGILSQVGTAAKEVAKTGLAVAGLAGQNAIDVATGSDWFENAEAAEKEQIKQSSFARVIASMGTAASTAAVGAYQENEEGLSRPLGLTPEASDAFKSVGILADVKKGQETFAQHFQNTVVNGLAQNLDLFVYRPAQVAMTEFNAVLGGVAGAGNALAASLGYKGEAGSEALEALMVTEGAMPGAFGAGRAANFAREVEASDTGLHAGYGLEATRNAVQQAIPLRTSTGVTVDVAKMQETHALADENVYFGLTPPTPEQAKIANDAAQSLADFEPKPVVPQSVYDIAHQIDPITMQKADNLDARKATYDQWMQQLADKRQLDAEASAPHADEIADLQNRMETATPRLQKKYQERLDKLLPEHDAFIADMTARDTPDMATVRDAIQQNDYAMRDIAVAKSEALEKVKARLPPEQVIEPPAPVPAPETPEVAPKTMVAPEGAPVTPEAAPARPIDVQKQAIADHATAQALSAGRPAEEANAYGALIASHYEAVAAQFEGRKGTAEELYQKHGADIQYLKEYVKPKRGAKAANEFASGEKGLISFAGRIKPLITVFEKGDASTLIHETGHQWLKEMLDNAADPDAPQSLKDDAATVRKHLKLKDGQPIPRGKHEQFAKTFERFMREGVAPSRELMGVFEKFKGYLESIYSTLSRLNVPINNEIRGVFDRLISAKPERTYLSVDRDPGKTFADIHESDAENTLPEHAADAREVVKSERRAIAQQQAPEAIHDITSGTSDASERRPAGGGESSGAVPEAGANIGEAGAIPQPGTVGAGGGEALPQGSAPPAGQPKGVTLQPGVNLRPDLYVAPRPKKLYSPVPRRPKTLADFIRTEGGVRDDGGEVRQALGGAKNRGLIRPNGISVDELAHRAWEAGYFPEKGAERPMPAEFLDKLDEDINRNPQYSDHDADAVRDYHAALDRNEEIDRIAGSLGIDQNGKTHAEFWNAVAEHMSAQKVIEEAASEAVSFETELREAQDLRKDALADRGEHWTPDHDTEHGTPQTLEELENARQQAEAAPREPGSAPGVSEPGSAAAGEGQLQESAGSRGGGAGAAGRTGDTAGEAGASESGSGAGSGGGIHQPVPKPDPIFKPDGTVDFSVVKNWSERMALPSDVDKFVMDSAENTGNFGNPGGGRISHAQTLELADAAGVPPSVLIKAQEGRIGATYNAHQLTAIGALWKTLSTEAQRLAFDKSDAGMVAFEAANNKFIMVTQHLLGATSEAGRSLNILNMLRESIKQARDIDEFFQRTVGKTREDISKQMDFMQKLNTPAQQARFIQDSAKPTFANKMVFYYINALLSGPVTHFCYAVGNAINAVADPLLFHLPAAALGAARQAITGEVAPDRVYFGEVGAELHALGYGSIQGLRAAFEGWKNDTSNPLPGARGNPNYSLGRNPFEGRLGAVIGLPVKSVQAIHTAFETLRYEQGIAGQAYRIATNEGLVGDAFKNRVADIIQRPSGDMIDQFGGLVSGKIDPAKLEAIENSVAGAMKELYMAPTEYGTRMYHLQKIIDSNAGLKTLVPFVKIKTQMLRNTFSDKTPLGVVFSKEIRDNLMGKNGGAAQDLQISKVLIGTSLMGAGVTMAAMGMVTGNGPTDPSQRAVWLMTNQPNSLKIGGTSISFDGLGPVGNLLLAGASMHEVASLASHEEMDKVAMAATEIASKIFIDGSALGSMKDVLDAAWHPTIYGPQFLRSYASNWLPFSSGQRQVARLTDPNQHEVHSEGWNNVFGLLDQIKNNTPLWSQSLLPKRDRFGEPVGHVDYKNDPVVDRLQALHMGITKPERSINGAPLSPEQHDYYTMKTGQFIKDSLNNMIRPGFEKLPEGIQVMEIHKQMENARKDARLDTMREYPDIPARASIIKNQKYMGEQQ